MSYVTDRAKKLGFRVHNGTKPLTLAVTNNDIVNSLKTNSKQCALARAAQRIPNVTRAYFFLTTAYLEKADQKVMERYVLPPSVQKEIVSFDRGGKFSPGIYQLSPPPAPPVRQNPKRTTSRASTQGVWSTSQTPRDTAAAATSHPAHLAHRLIVRTRFVRGTAEPE